MNNLKLYVCNDCNYTVELFCPSGIEDLKCCEKSMTEIIANTQEAAHEKHIPVAKLQDDNMLYIQVGSIEHPMSDEHYISAIYVVTDAGNMYKKVLNSNDSPEFTCDILNAKKVCVYAYCNLHGLWKTEIDI